MINDALPRIVDFQFLAEHSADLICRIGLDKVIRYASPSSLHILGYTPEEILSLAPNSIVLPEDLPLIAASAGRLLAPGVTNSQVTVRMRKKDGSIVWTESNARLVRDSETGDPIEFVLVIRDITERKLHEEKLSAQALTDGLTGLANRRAFDEALEKEWKRALREESRISLLMLDLDCFKAFNDRYGHKSGDDCLRAVGTAVAGTVRRAIDVVARYGGEEFAIILPCTDVDGAMLVAEKIRRAIVDLRIRHCKNQGGIVTASIGVSTAFARHDGMIPMPESILLSADYALYQAKHDGRNRISNNVLDAPSDVARMEMTPYSRDRTSLTGASLSKRFHTYARSITSRRS